MHTFWRALESLLEAPWRRFSEIAPSKKLPEACSKGRFLPRCYWCKMSRKFGHSCSIVQRRQWHPTPVLLPGKSHGWKSLVGCSLWGLSESDTTEWLPFHFSLSCIGEGNGNLLQCSCLENPRDGGAWWAAVYGVAQSRTRLKRLSSSSSSIVSTLIMRWGYSDMGGKGKIAGYPEPNKDIHKYLLSICCMQRRLLGTMGGEGI